MLGLQMHGRRHAPNSLIAAACMENARRDMHTCRHADRLQEHGGPEPTRARMLLGWSDMRHAERELLRHKVLPSASARLAKRPTLWAARNSRPNRSALQPACPNQSVRAVVLSTYDQKNARIWHRSSALFQRLSWQVPDPPHLPYLTGAKTFRQAVYAASKKWTAMCMQAS